MQRFSSCVRGILAWGIWMAWGSHGPAWGVTPTTAEMDQAKAWVERMFGTGPDAAAAVCPVSFTYGGEASGAVLAQGKRRVMVRPEDAGPGSGATPRVEQREVMWTDLGEGLKLRVEAVRFLDSPAVEWVGWFTNTGTQRTPILENIQALDAGLGVSSDQAPVVHWAKGGVASFDDFAPQEWTARPGTKLRLQPGGGRSSSEVMPYFNVAGPAGGVVAAVGWSGEWAAEFAGASPGQVTLRAGLARTHLVLEPGETIRTPRMMLLFYRGDRWRGQNLLRQFILAHHRPTVNGKPLMAPITCGNWGGTSAEVHLDNIQQIVRQQLPVDYYWIDAEWYGQGPWPSNVGSWSVKKDLYPQGFKPLSDALRAAHRELMLWFEPERVYRGSTWHKEHPEWLLDRGHDSLLLNLGIPAARRFVTDFISDRIREFGLGCYRQDFNLEPLPFWRAADAPDREGITEIRYIEGLYAFWDELLRRHPGLILDNCASGGRRLDLEATGRATPFWRTDGPRDPIAHQCHTYGLLAWLPFSATSQDRAGDDYEFRSSMCSSLCLNWWVSGDVAAQRIPATFPFEWARTTLRQYQALRGAYYGDYYPLTRYSTAPDAWMAYQLDRPDEGRGWVVVLRRPESPYETARLSLRALVPEAVYAVRNADSGETAQQRGADFMEAGFQVTLNRKPGSALFEYQRK